MDTPRRQRRHDHRLIELVGRTGDVDYATPRGVPRSTDAGWLAQPALDVDVWAFQTRPWIFCGRRDFQSMDHFHAWFRLTQKVGSTCELEILRRGKQRTLKLPVIE